MNNAALNDHIEQLAQCGQWHEAIELLSAQNRHAPDTALERQLVDLRVQAFSQTVWPCNDQPWPPAFVDPFPHERALPETNAQALDAALLGGAVRHHGGLIVRNFVPAERISTLVHDIDQAVEQRNRRARGEAINQDDPYYAPSDFLNAHYKLGVGRKFIAETGGVWAADSPRSVFDVMELYRELRLNHLLADYFCEAPCVSVKKWVLRRVDPIAGEADWHQDGAFMGKDVRSMNLWIALSDCGGDSINPGIDIVPRYFDHIVQTGTDGARFDWTVGPDYVEQHYTATPWVRPAFKAGDALFFDHMNLHRTAWAPHITGRRYAIECWFFAASVNAANQIPMFF